MICAVKCFTGLSKEDIRGKAALLLNEHLDHFAPSVFYPNCGSRAYTRIRPSTILRRSLIPFVPIAFVENRPGEICGFQNPFTRYRCSADRNSRVDGGCASRAFKPRGALCSFAGSRLGPLATSQSLWFRQAELPYFGASACFRSRPALQERRQVGRPVPST